MLSTKEFNQIQFFKYYFSENGTIDEKKGGKVQECQYAADL